jgi:hypothetical protein
VGLESWHGSGVSPQHSLIAGQKDSPDMLTQLQRPTDDLRSQIDYIYGRCNSLIGNQRITQIHDNKREITMKTIKSVNVGSFALYGAVLAALWAFVLGVYYWLLGWLFGAQSWYIDMNLGNWTVYTMTTFGLIFLKAFIAGAGGALAGAITGWIYNIVAGMMGGLKLNLE